jgi:hypothetical protein
VGRVSVFDGEVVSLLGHRSRSPRMTNPRVTSLSVPNLRTRFRNRCFIQGAVRLGVRVSHRRPLIGGRRSCEGRPVTRHHGLSAVDGSGMEAHGRSTAFPLVCPQRENALVMPVSGTGGHARERSEPSLQAGGRGFDSSPLSLLEGGRGDGRSSSPGHVDSLGGNARPHRAHKGKRTMSRVFGLSMTRTPASRVSCWFGPCEVLACSGWSLVLGAVGGGGSTHLSGRGGARVSVRSARGLNQPVGPPVGAIAKAEFARAAAASRRRMWPSRRP